MMRAAFVNCVRCSNIHSLRPRISIRTSTPLLRTYSGSARLLASRISPDLKTAAEEIYWNGVFSDASDVSEHGNQQRLADGDRALSPPPVTLPKPLHGEKDDSGRNGTIAATDPSLQDASPGDSARSSTSSDALLLKLRSRLQELFPLAEVNAARHRLQNSARQFAWIERIRRRGKQFGQLGVTTSSSPQVPVTSEADFVDWGAKYDGIVYREKPASREWLEAGSWLSRLQTSSAMQKAWMSLDAEERKTTWTNVMLATLYFSPDKAASVLSATLNPLPPNYALYDVLLFIARRQNPQLFSATATQRVQSANQVLELLEQVLNSFSKVPAFSTGRLFGLLARYLPTDHVVELYEMLQHAGHKLEYETMLSFATRFSLDEQHKRKALGLIITLLKIDNQNAALGKVTTSLLTYRSPTDRDSEASQFLTPEEALQTLVEHNYVPNLIGITAALDALCKRGEFEEAARLALLFSEEGVQLDKKAAHKLLNGAKRSLQPGHIRKAFEVAKVTDMPFVDVLDHGLDALAHFGIADSFRQERRKSPWTMPLFLPMLRIYEKRFQIEPLQRWFPDSLPLLLMEDHGHKDPSGDPHWRLFNSLVPVVDEVFSTNSSEKIAPSPSTVATMLVAYIRGLEESADVLKFYQFFKSRLEGDKPRGPFDRLIRKKHSLVHDAFIRAMMERPELTRAALQVFGDMLQGHLRRLGTPKSKQGQKTGADIDKRLLGHPAPSLITFTIVIGGLMSRGNATLAEQMIQVLHEHGLKPDLPLWNTVIKGYASAQDISSTVGALRRMEAGGFHMNDRTMKAFAKLGDQKAAMEAMESIIKNNMERIVVDQVHLDTNNFV